MQSILPPRALKGEWRNDALPLLLLLLLRLEAADGLRNKKEEPLLLLSPA